MYYNYKFMKNLTVILLVFISALAFTQTNLEISMVTEINELRSNPKSFIPHVEVYIKFNNNFIERINSGKMKIKSTSGSVTKSNKTSNSKTISGKDVILERIKAAKELIIILNSITPLDTLAFNYDMYTITKGHAEYLYNTNKISHYDYNGNRASDRFKLFNLNVSENLVSVGTFTKDDPIPLILSLLVDAGIQNRGHRKNILNNNIRFISVSVVGGVCVQNFAN